MRTVYKISEFIVLYFLNKVLIDLRTILVYIYRNVDFSEIITLVKLKN